MHLNKPKIVLIGIVGSAAIAAIVLLPSAKRSNHDLAGRLRPIPGPIVLPDASPDGKWVLQSTGMGDNVPHFPVAQEKNGTHTITWPYRFYNNDGHWLADSRQWVSLETASAGKTLLVFSLDKPQIKRILLSLPPDAGDLLGVTPQGHALFSNPCPDVRSRIGSDTLTVADADITTNPPTIRTFSIKKPDQQNGDWGRVSLSPQGDRLAWVYFSNQPSGITAWFTYWTKHSYAGGKETLDIWVSRLDGSAPHYVGNLNGQSLSFGACWAADGKSLNLTVGDKSYAAPVD